MTKTIPLLLTLLGACAHEQLPPPQAQGEYHIGREDVIAVEVWKDPALSAKVPVRPDGNISLPMVGEVQAAGRTASELKTELLLKLTPFVENPVVSVMVAEVNAAKVFVMGEVAHPGAFPMKGNLSVVQAVALAGGTTEFASPRNLVLIRNDESGKPIRYRVNLSKLEKGDEGPVPVMAGDTLVVP